MLEVYWDIPEAVPSFVISEAPGCAMTIFSVHRLAAVPSVCLEVEFACMYVCERTDEEKPETVFGGSLNGSDVLSCAEWRVRSIGEVGLDCETSDGNQGGSPQYARRMPDHQGINALK